MTKGVKLLNHKNHSDILDTYNKPEFVYIPLVNGTDTDITILVKKGDYVYKGTHLGKRKGNIKIPIISTVSGKVVDFVAKPYLNGTEVKCVKIENDFKEKTEETEEYETINKSEFLTILHDKGIIGLGGAGFPTHIKYDTTNKIKYLLVNAVECEPYITADYEVLKRHPEEILEAIDMILEINHIEKAVIAVKKNNTELIKILNNFIGTYLKIKIKEVPNLYPMGFERTLIKEVFHETYDKLPIEKGIIVNNVSTVYAIYKAVKYNEPLTERIVTFAGDGFDSPRNVLVKIGTEVKEIIDSLISYQKEEINFIAGGPMMGEGISSSELVVSPNLNCILVMEHKPNMPIECLRCGKCVDVCPVGICPVLIKDNIDRLDALRELDVNKCIGCGLCSYICPSKILVREYVRTAKEKLKGSEKSG